MSEGRVLIVDDEPNVRKMVGMALRKGGFDVIEAEDGQKGIEAIRSGDNPLVLDTIVCDIHMPNLNGLEAIAYFRSQFPSVPVIVLTGQPNIDNAAELFKNGVVDYLVKPVQPEKLVEAVTKAVKKHELFKDQYTV
jgi:two-component system, chemotaxis family, chemotaxis protein CheY